MTKWLRRGMFSVLGLLVLLVLLMLAVQLLRSTAYGEPERAAVALASVAPPPPRGLGGYAALALSDFDIPADAIDAEMTVEVGQFRQWLAQQGDALAGLDGEARFETWQPRMAQRHPARAPMGDLGALCPFNGAGCLALAKADTGALRQRMAAQSARLALVDRALAADHLHSPYPSSHLAPTLPYGTLRLSLTQAALDAVDGRVPDAMARACRTLAAARRFNAGARDLVGKMVSPALAEGSALLLLELRREYPAVPLPDSCAPALVPLQAGDYLVCEALRGEFRMAAAVSASQDRALSESWTPTAVFTRRVLMDSRLHDAWMAQTLAAPCTESYQRQVLAGSVPPPPERPVSRGDQHCYAAAINCLLAQIALPAYGDYQGRLLDHAARLRLLLAGISAVGTDNVAAAGLHAAAASPGYGILVDSEARTLSLQTRFTRAGTAKEFKVAF